MPKRNRVAALNEFAKSEAFKSAKDTDAFILIKRSDIVGEGKDESGERVIFLKYDAEVSGDIRKDALQSDGYGQDDADDMFGNGPDPDHDGDKHKEHLANLADAVTKAAAAHAHFQKVLGADGLSGDPEEDRSAMPHEKDPSLSASHKTGDLAKRDDVAKLIEAANKDLLKAVQAMFEQGKSQAPAPRKEDAGAEEGKLIAKSVVDPNIEETVELERELVKMRDRRKELIEKRERGLPLSEQERYEAATINDKIRETEMRQLRARQLAGR